MKKETKRYMLIEFAGIEERVLNSKEEYDHLIATLTEHRLSIWYCEAALVLR